MRKRLVLSTLFVMLLTGVSLAGCTNGFNEAVQNNVAQQNKEIAQNTKACKRISALLVSGSADFSQLIGIGIDTPTSFGTEIVNWSQRMKAAMDAGATGFEAGAADSFSIWNFCDGLGVRLPD